MSESLSFHRDLYRLDALDEVAARHSDRASITVRRGDAGIELEFTPTDPAEAVRLRADLSNDALRLTAARMRNPSVRASDPQPATDAPSWWLVVHEPGTPLGNGWTLESVGPIRDGSSTMLLSHESGTTAEVGIHRNAGAPVGVAHTDDLDLVWMNGGAGATVTDLRLAQVLVAMTNRIRRAPELPSRRALIDSLDSHAERAPAGEQVEDARAPAEPPTPRIDAADALVRFELDEATTGRMPLYDALVPLTERATVVLSRPADGRVVVEVALAPGREGESLEVLADEVARALLLAMRATIPVNVSGPAPASAEALDALVEELAEADATTFGVGFRPERATGHPSQRVLNLRGTGACDSDCVFCVEKFDPKHRLMQAADATRESIVESAGQFDVLFFASGEPTIHPKLFEYAALARSVGFASLGMSSHFRTFADPAFSRKTLEAGFRYFDISLHAADLAGQLDVNPIDDGGRSLNEALKGLAVMFRLAQAMGIEIDVTHKIVVSKMNVTSLREIVKATYDRGVRNFIVQPVRATGLVPLRKEKVAIAESEIVPHLNDLLEWAGSLEGAVVKPYGFSRKFLVEGAHVELEQNRVKNVYGRVREEDGGLELPPTTETPAADGRHWVVVTNTKGQRFGFAADGTEPVLDRALEKGAEMPFGCRMGSCGMCAARLVEGSVDQSSQAFLTPSQVEAGFVLLCQAKPCSDVVVRICREHEIDAL